MLFIRQPGYTRRLEEAKGGSCDHRRPGTVLAEGQQVPEGVLVAGMPGKVRRDLSEAERAAIERNAATYIALSELHRRGGA
jgi:carbonic anhydrase/acetyltransferase-like protein (isoleucine patch superfamily)